MTGNRRDLENRLEELRKREGDETPDNLSEIILEMSKEGTDDE